MINEEDNIYIYCKERLGHREDWPEILENLDDASNTPACGFNKDSRNLDRAFVWAMTNQDHAYWSNLHREADNFIMFR